MNINYKQPQFELFPANSATLEDVNKPKFMLANLTLSIESLVVFSILGIMVGLFSFSLGVERGKQLAAQALDERVAAAWNVGIRKPVLPQPAAAVAAVSATTLQQGMAQRGNAGFIKKVPVATAKPVLPTNPAVMPKQAPVAKPLAKAVPVGGNVTIQLATYKNENYAKNAAMALKAQGFQPFLMKKGDFWLVCSGRFASIENASAYLKKLPAKYRASQIRRF
jgi:cell division septation protein DedD